MPKIVVFSGSARKGSFNSQIAAMAADIAANAGATVESIRLQDFGKRAIGHLRQQLENIRVKVADETFSLGKAGDALADKDAFKSSPSYFALDRCVRNFVAGL